MTKIEQVKRHLKINGTITSWEAIEQYGATRLSAIIFVLRDRGMKIKTFNVSKTDRNGNTCVFAKYSLKGE